MFLFYHSKQNPENASYYKGVLFENLLREFLTKRGYNVNVGRLKENSLEYDIFGTHSISKTQVIGEAKAHSKSIGADVITSFVGKLIGKGLAERKITGLFISTSPLTPEASNYYDNLREKGFYLEKITDKVLYKSIKEDFPFLPIDILKDSLNQRNFSFLSESLLQTDNQLFLVLICGTPNSVNPSFFLLVNQKGDEITDPEFVSKLKLNIKELSHLSYIKSEIKKGFRGERIIKRGLFVGDSWTDFRFPAAPQYFIGRENICKEIFDLINKNSDHGIIQIKSRSGVGKSSILSFLDSKFHENNIHTEIHDARDIRSILDFFSIVQRFTNSSYLPNDFVDVEEQLESLYYNKELNKAVLMIDQFESTFTNPDVFYAYEGFLNIVFNYKSKFFVIITRKSDQLTTYDESKISLTRINSISIPIELTDFEPSEAKLLIEKINEDSRYKISSEVKAYVLELSSGFPWALKRVMAHIIRMLKLGSTQKELLERNLRLEDLFDEELRGLEESEKGFLKRIAIFLPSTLEELEYKLNEDRHLRKKLEKLTTAKLLRLTGETYDTYNDVFKEYLVTGKVPDYNPTIIYRSSPSPLLRLLHELITSKKDVFPLEDVQEISGTTKGYAFSLVKELSNLNLMRNIEKYWEIPEVVREFYSRKRLGEYIRNQLYENNLVIKIIERMEAPQKLTIQSLTIFLSKLLPFIEANEKTWTSYSKYMISWLELTKIIEVTKNDELLIETRSPEEIFAEIENLTEIKYKSESFLPNSSFKSIEESFSNIIRDRIPLNRINYKVLSDLKRGGWIINNTLTVNDMSELKKQAIEQITSENHNKIWDAAKNGEILFPIFKEIFGESYTDMTNRVMLGKLINWGKALGIIPNKNYKYIKREFSFDGFKLNRGNRTVPRKLIEHRKLQSELLWNTHYRELENFIIKHKHSSIPRNGSTRTLAYWSTSMRMKRKRNLLSEEKIDLLNQINFDWDPNKNTWDIRYRHLLNFKEKFGHTHVPKEYESKLHFWVKNQRMNLYQNKLPAEKKLLLLKIGLLDKFDPLSVEPIPAYTMNLLKKYYNAHGHINVPQLDKENKYLGRWINSQRIERKRGRLKKERETILEKMGIAWNIKEFNWDKKLNELNSFFKQYGHFNVTRQHNRSLGKWLYDLKRKQPPAEKLRKLLEIGFDWEKEHLS